MAEEEVNPNREQAGSFSGRELASELKAVDIKNDNIDVLDPVWQKKQLSNLTKRILELNGESSRSGQAQIIRLNTNLEDHEEDSGFSLTTVPNTDYVNIVLDRDKFSDINRMLRRDQISFGEDASDEERREFKRESTEFRNVAYYQINVKSGEARTIPYDALNRKASLKNEDITDPRMGVFLIMGLRNLERQENNRISGETREETIESN